MKTQRKIAGISIAGLVLLVLGIVLLLDNLHLIYFDLGDFISNWWPAILILLGVNELFKNNRTGGWFLIGFGVVLLLKINHFIDGSMLFAGVLILVGIIMLIRPGRGSFRVWPASSEHEKNGIDLSAVFSESRENVTSDKFTGGNIQAIFGKMLVDLRGVKIADGRCRLNVEIVFGRARLVVPPGIRIEITGTPVFGRIDNQLVNNPKDENSAIMEIHVDIVFGNLEIHN